MTGELGAVTVKVVTGKVALIAPAGTVMLAEEVSHSGQSHHQPAVRREKTTFLKELVVDGHAISAAKFTDCENLDYLPPL